MAVEQHSEEGLEERLNRLEALVALTLLNSRDIDSRTQELVQNWLDHLNPEKRKSLFDSNSSWLITNPEQENEINNIKERVIAYDRHLGEVVEFVLALGKDVSGFNQNIRRMQKDIDELEVEVASVSEDLHSLFVMSFLNIDTDKVELNRFMPVRLYASGGSASDEMILKSSLEALLSSVDFVISDEFPVIYASWFGRYWARTKNASTREAVTNRLERLERAIELQGLDKPQAEVDEKYFNAASNFIKSIEASANVAAQIGPLLIVKITKDGVSNVQVKKLSIDQLMLLEKNQSWFQSPPDIFMKLGVNLGPTKDIPDSPESITIGQGRSVGHPGGVSKGEGDEQAGDSGALPPPLG